MSIYLSVHQTDLQNPIEFLRLHSILQSLTIWDLGDP